MTIASNIAAPIARNIAKKDFRTAQFTSELQDGLVLWLDPSDSTTRTMDVGVETLTDKSTSGNDYTNTTDAQQPLLGKIGYRDSLRFTGTQFLNGGQPANMDFTAGTDEFTIITVAIVTGGNTGSFLSKTDSAVVNSQFLGFITSDDYASYVGGVRGSNSVEKVVNTPKIFTTKVTLTNVYDYVEGVQTDTRAVSGTATNAYDWLLGAIRNSSNTGSSLLLTGDVGEVLVFNKALTASEQQAVELYLRNKWIYNNTLILLGASIMNDIAQFSGIQTIINRGYNVSIDIVNAGEAGETIEDISSRVDTVLSTSGRAGGHVFIHAGGNNVTDDRPFSSVSAASRESFLDSLNYILTAVVNAKMIPVLSDLTFRDYDDTTVYLEQNGSRPFNENLINPHYFNRHPEWCFDASQPYAQLYDLFRNSYTTFIGADNIHHLAAGRVAAATHIGEVVYGVSLYGTTPQRIYSPSGDDMQLWHDYSDTSTITDTAGAVTAITDKSQRGLTITTTSAPTTNSVTINDLNALDFDGVDNHLNLGQPTSLEFTPRTNAFTIFMVTEVAAATAGALISKAGSTPGDRQAYLYAQNTNTVATAGGTSETYAADIRGAVKVLSLVVSTTTQRLYIDGTLVDTGAIGTATNSNDWLIGARRNDDVNGGLAFELTGKVGEVIIYSSEQTDAERSRTTSYLMRKWKNS